MVCFIACFIRFGDGEGEPCYDSCVKSPFPGMDPYLEDPAFWEGFHHVFITECMYFLLERLPPTYVADVGERVELISRSDPAAEQYLPDVAVVTRERSGAADSRAERPSQSGGGAAVAIAPVTIPSLESLEVREGYIQVLRLPERKLVTSIELLSPWNKFGDGVGEYRHKRRSMVNHGVNVVELDLLRRGRRTELAAPLPQGHYYAFVFRADRRPDVDVYAWGLPDPLPPIPVPLAPADPEIALDLGVVVNTSYERGQYGRKLKYSGPPPGPLMPSEVAWAGEITREISARK